MFCAAFLDTSVFAQVPITVAPFSFRTLHIIWPKYPVAPVTRAVFPATENKSLARSVTVALHRQRIGARLQMILCYSSDSEIRHCEVLQFPGLCYLCSI